MTQQPETPESALVRTAVRDAPWQAAPRCVWYLEHVQALLDGQPSLAAWHAVRWLVEQAKQDAEVMALDLATRPDQESEEPAWMRSESDRYYQAELERSRYCQSEMERGR